MLSRAVALRRAMARTGTAAPAAATATSPIRCMHAGSSGAVRAPSFSVTASPTVIAGGSGGATSVMPVLQTIVAMRHHRQQLWNRNQSVGFVPTMGALHDGHLDLVRRAQKECDRVVVSIYVNPTQFGAGEDFTKYPRQLAADCQKLKGLADVVFAPSDKLMYRRANPPHATFVTVDGLHATTTSSSATGDGGEPVSSALVSAEARARPTHFRGVATVVTKLFNIVQPTRAYFGAKDGMQCILIRRIVRELNLPTRVVVCPTKREADGLAMSSRNVYLTATDRQIAPIVYRALKAGKAAFIEGGADVQHIKRAVTDVLSSERAITIQYVSVADTGTGAELIGSLSSSTAAAAARERMEGEEPDADDDAGADPSAVAMLSVAVKLGQTRLIDNILLGAD